MAGDLLAFLSYASEDLDRVLPIYQEVSRMGVRPWMDKKDLVGGEDWERAIERTLRRAAFVLLFLSKSAVVKRGVLRREITIALDAVKEKLPDDLYLIPLRLEQCEVPEELKRLQWIDLFVSDGLTRLRATIEEGLVRRGLARKVDSSSRGLDVTLVQSSWRPTDSRFDIDLKIPEFHGLSDSLDQRFVNDVIRTSIEQRARAFVGFARDDFPGGDFSCGPSVKRLDQNIISVYLGFDYYASGAAHPNADTLSFNFVLQPAYMLSLRDLFAHGAWQKMLVKLCSVELHRRRGDQEQPDLDEKIERAFDSREVHFNVNHENLLLTFSPGVVWWRVPDQVAIPFSNISELLAGRLPLRDNGAQ